MFRRACRRLGIRGVFGEQIRERISERQSIREQGGRQRIVKPPS
jgi:hypothetical protein